MLTPEQHAARARKIERLKAGAPARALEVCSGCGGLSLGLSAAGFDLAAHIEIDPEAAESYAINFGAGKRFDDPWSIARDMEHCSAEELVRDLKLGISPIDAFDLLAAGLPCQAFARIGRSKLRAIAGGKDDAFQKDPRAALYRRFLNYVVDVQPLVIVIENVPDILNFGGHNVPEEICETLERIGYRTGYTILNAGYYGVPQVRERLFVIGFADALGIAPEFPEPTHFLDLPKGYEGSRRVALKHVDENSKHFRAIHTPSRKLEKANTVRQALGDLPKIKEHIVDPKVIRRRRLTDMLPYRAPRGGVSAYAKLMRNWEGFATKRGTDGHLVRLTPRDFPIFQKMAHGADYPEARRLAETMFAAMLRKKRMTRVSRTSKAYAELRDAIVPPYDPDKFPNKWWKLDPAKPSRTLTAHMGKDTYSHIHYDSYQCRTVSVREAARLQSFPDGFKFAGAMNSAFRQIGNAVPPLLGLAVANSIKSQLADALAVLVQTAPTSTGKEQNEQKAA
ncbi:DNA cytosine methyltransferase [Bradyrhizobium japonicum]|uniref:DNA cytosine methyltransferase n=1 Tax=Bradyrhizobium japonicum TaxID=375 RepID=UPI001BA7D157|nr:DNA cytosine methyltransferase [Bradyrhizobium japonicum]MBR0911504.1 DNA cytosine methyltransferase [Bradyrhizobium japonicum]